MIRKIKTLIVSAAALFFIAAPVAVPVTVLAATPAFATTTTQSGINNGLNCGADINLDPNKTTCAPTDQSTSLSSKIATVINIFSAIIAAVAVIMIIYGGFRYITSGGKQESVSGAKTTILYALIGLVIVALAQVIVQFVLNKATG